LKQERLVVGAMLRAWQKRTNDRDPSLVHDFNPVTVIEDSLRIGGQPLADVKAVDENPLALQMEKGMWQTWLVDFGWTNKVAQGRLTGSQDVNVGRGIEKRCLELGLNPDPLMIESLRARKREYRQWGKANPDLLD